ncbi:MAG TPA: hypothetical protein VN660_05450 [Steroidobacteraceae bacterium]|nr:hypothetical protein [Steroidobacteraceae bacterium]
MKRTHLPTLGVAVAAITLWAGAALASSPANERAEATLPQAAYRITNWGLDGHKGIWIEAGVQNYYGEFLSPCWGALPDRILFKFNPDGSLNRFSEVVVPHDRQICAFKSFQAGSMPIDNEAAQEQQR